MPGLRDRRLERLSKRLGKKAKRGFRGYPIATVALYGPTDKRASKLVVSIVATEGEEPHEMRKWFADGEADLRSDADILEEVLNYIQDQAALSVVTVDRIIGCPHEEGIDYEGPTCPQCPFWAGRDRSTGEMLH